MTDRPRSPNTELVPAPIEPRRVEGSGPPQAGAGAEPFHVAYETHFAFVWHGLLRLGVRGADLADLTHDVFAVAFRRWGTFDASRPLRPWLFGILYRVALDFQRKLQNQREVPVDAPAAVDARMAADDAVAERQAQALALRIIDAMPLEQRAVFVMHDLEGEAMPHIAEALSVPLNTAYSRLRLARRHFNEQAKALQQEVKP